MYSLGAKADSEVKKNPGANARIVPIEDLIVPTKYQRKRVNIKRRKDDISTKEREDMSAVEDAITELCQVRWKWSPSLQHRCCHDRSCEMCKEDNEYGRQVRESLALDEYGPRYGPIAPEEFHCTGAVEIEEDCALTKPEQGSARRMTGREIESDGFEADNAEVESKGISKGKARGQEKTVVTPRPPSPSAGLAALNPESTLSSFINVERVTLEGQKGLEKHSPFWKLGRLSWEEMSHDDRPQTQQ